MAKALAILVDATRSSQLILALSAAYVVYNAANSAQVSRLVFVIKNLDTNGDPMWKPYSSVMVMSH